MEGDPAGVQVRGSEPALSRAWNAPLPPAPAPEAAAGGPVRRPRRGLSLPSITCSSPCSPSAFKVAPRGRPGFGGSPRNGQRGEPGQRQRREAGGLGEARAQTRVHSDRKGAWVSGLARGDSPQLRAPGSGLGFPVLGYYLGKCILSEGYFLKLSHLPVMLNVCLEKNSALPPGSLIQNIYQASSKKFPCEVTNHP